MNRPAAIRQRQLEKFPFEKVLANVDTSLGHFSIGFLPQTLEYRKKIRAGSTQNEHVNERMAESLSAIEKNAPEQRNGIVARLFALLPKEFVIAGIRNMTATFAYTHCELAFALKDNSPMRTDQINVMNVAIHADVGVFMAPRKFHTEYEWVHVRCTETQMKAMLFFAYEEQGKRFSSELMSKSVVNPGPDDRSVYFCSHFTMACLEFLPFPVFHFNRANAQTIDDIYSMVSSDEVRAKEVNVVPQAQMTAIWGTDTARVEYVERPGQKEIEARKKAAKHKA
jgi:hypothetical protein